MFVDEAPTTSHHVASATPTSAAPTTLDRVMSPLSDLVYQLKFTSVVPLSVDFEPPSPDAPSEEIVYWAVIVEMYCAKYGICRASKVARLHELSAKYFRDDIVTIRGYLASLDDNLQNIEEVYLKVRKVHKVAEKQMLSKSSHSSTGALPSDVNVIKAEFAARFIAGQMTENSQYLRGQVDENSAETLFDASVIAESWAYASLLSENSKLENAMAVIKMADAVRDAVSRSLDAVADDRDEMESRAPRNSEELLFVSHDQDEILRQIPNDSDFDIDDDSSLFLDI